MLLKVGAATMLSAVALALVVTVVVSISRPKEKLISPAASVVPLAAEAETREKRGFDPGQRLEIDEPKPPEEKPQVAEPPAEQPSEKTSEKTSEQAPEEPSDEKRQGAGSADKQLPRTEPRGEPPAKPPEEPPEEPSAAKPDVRDEAQKTPPVAPDDWPEPSGEEVAAAEAPRYYAPRRDSSLALTVEAIGLYDVPVTNASSQQALDGGVIHFPQTPMPWDERPQKNVYLAGHRLGWPGTKSRLVFYNLDKLRRGDPIMLRDSLGNPYEYRVSEVFVVRPDADWAVDPVRGRDMLTLQTCTLPDLQNRMIVRADRVRPPGGLEEG